MAWLNFKPKITTLLTVLLDKYFANMSRYAHGQENALE